MAVLSPKVREVLRGERGVPARDTQIARIAMGSAIMVATIGLAIAGRISGGGPDDWKEREALRASGWQPYSVRIGNKWISYQRVDPWSFIVGIAADMVEMQDALSHAEANKVGGMVLNAISTALVNKTWLKGPADFIEAASSGRPGSWEHYLKGLAGSVIPTIVAHGAQQIDPVLRDSRTVLDRIKSRTPWVSRSLPPRRDIFGEEIRLEGSVGPDMLSPFFVSTIEDNPIAKVMIEIGYFPSKPGRTINGHPLTGEQYDRYSELAGKDAVRRLEPKVSSPSWAKRSVDAREKAIRTAFDEARERARKKMKTEYPELRKKFKK